MNQKQIIHLLKTEQMTLTDVIDAVIQVNGIIGVGKYTLADNVADYIKNHKGYKHDTTRKEN